jgi:opine dehydrogenase
VKRSGKIMKKKVAILGGGNGAFAMASDLALQGFEVRMWSKYFEELSEIKKTRTIKVSGPMIQGEAKISVITDQIAEAIKGVDLICLNSSIYSTIRSRKPFASHRRWAGDIPFPRNIWLISYVQILKGKRL